MSEFTSSLLSGIISGIVTGLIVGIFLYRYQKLRDFEERRKISPLSLKKILPTNILDYVSPGISIEKVKEYFGIPDYLGDKELAFFMKDEDFVSTNSYLYNFLNCSVKITSQNKTNIDTVTIFSFGDVSNTNRIEVAPNRFSNENRIVLGTTALKKEHLENLTNHFGNKTNRETIFAAETYLGRFGNYLNYSYFCTRPVNFEQYEISEDPTLLIGSTIDGFCVSAISEFAPSISVYETV